MFYNAEEITEVFWKFHSVKIYWKLWSMKIPILTIIFITLLLISITVSVIQFPYFVANIIAVTIDFEFSFSCL
jgi:hypothetical protein